MKDIKELLKKKMKSGDKLEGTEKEAMRGAIGGLRKMAADMMREDMDGKMSSLKKVTVASDSKEGLEKGLDKAKEIVEGKEEDYEDEKFSPEGDSDEESADDIEAAIMKLQEKLAKKRAE
jgi:hypothetical protein